MIVDVHNHAIPAATLDLLHGDASLGATFAKGNINICGFEFPFLDAYHDPKAKRAELEKHQIDAAVLSIAPPAFLYELPPDKSELVCKVTNEGFVHFAEQSPDRFRWMAHVPMHAPDRAVSVLREAKAMGAVGVEIATSISGHRSDHPMFEPFWAAAQELQLLVMIHPWYNNPYPGLADWHLQNVLGNPQETMIAASRIICSGLLDRMPHLRVLLVHGGGHLPYQLGRLRHAIAVRPELADVSSDPWTYVGRLQFDSLTHDVMALAYLVERVGIENVFLGTDLPFDMAPLQPIPQIREALGTHGAKIVCEQNPIKAFHFA